MTPALIVIGFLVWLVVGVIFGIKAKNPAACPYKWLIAWPLGLILLLCGLVYMILVKVGIVKEPDTEDYT